MRAAGGSPKPDQPLKPNAEPYYLRSVLLCLRRDTKAFAMHLHQVFEGVLGLIAGKQAKNQHQSCWGACHHCKHTRMI